MYQKARAIGSSASATHSGTTFPAGVRMLPNAAAIEGWNTERPVRMCVP
jgi:hypothetical protein